MDLDTILFIVSGVLAVASTIFGLRFAAVKKALKETKEALVASVWLVQVRAFSILPTS